jgi:hypothetical protein
LGEQLGEKWRVGRLEENGREWIKYERSRWGWQQQQQQAAQRQEEPKIMRGKRGACDGGKRKAKHERASEGGSKGGQTEGEGTEQREDQGGGRRARPTDFVIKR